MGVMAGTIATFSFEFCLFVLPLFSLFDTKSLRGDLRPRFTLNCLDSFFSPVLPLPACTSSAHLYFLCLLPETLHLSSPMPRSTQTTRSSTATSSRHQAQARATTRAAQHVAWGCRQEEEVSQQKSADLSKKDGEQEMLAYCYMLNSGC